ncbi:hypothetical protein BGY98DRAFT_967574, partial [Russula aff. rugulosa BPL654]
APSRVCPLPSRNIPPLDFPHARTVLPTVFSVLATALLRRVPEGHTFEFSGSLYGVSGGALQGHGAASASKSMGGQLWGSLISPVRFKPIRIID